MYICVCIYLYSMKLYTKNNRNYEEKNKARCRLLKIYATLNHGTKKTIA